MIRTREEAIKQCEEFIKYHSDWSVEIEWANGVEFVLEDYKRLIEQEPRKGHWIRVDKDKTDRPMAECNVCGWYVNPNWIKEYSFCPNCGADMREVEE